MPTWCCHVRVLRCMNRCVRVLVEAVLIRVLRRRGQASSTCRRDVIGALGVELGVRPPLLEPSHPSGGGRRRFPPGRPAPAAGADQPGRVQADGALHRRTVAGNAIRPMEPQAPCSSDFWPKARQARWRPPPQWTVTSSAVYPVRLAGVHTRPAQAPERRARVRGSERRRRSLEDLARALDPRRLLPQRLAPSILRT